MKSMRNLLCVLTAVVTVAFALPAVALDKTFSISTPTTTILPAGQTTSNVVVRFKNDSSGNSTIKSLTLTVSPDVTIVTASGQSGNAAVNNQTHTVTLTGIMGVKPGLTFDVTLQLSVGSAAVCGMSTWTGAAFAGNNVGITAFSPVSPHANEVTTYVGCDFSIACGATLDKSTFGPPNTAPGPDVPGYAVGERGAYNVDGSTSGTCFPVIFGLTNNILDPNAKRVTLKYNPPPGTLAQPDAFFSYDLAWQVTSKAPPSPYAVVQSQWQSGAGLGGLVPTPFCLSAVEPAPYGTLGSDSGDGTIVVNNVTALPNGKFFTQIQHEVLQVTKVTGTTWTVLRAQLGTTQVLHTGGDVLNVMSTPFPAVPNDPLFTNAGYIVGTQAKVCAAEETAASASGGMFQYFTTIFETGGDPVHVGP